MAKERMNPVSGETVETDGIYKTEWGREELLKRGDEFPSDPILGASEWELVQLPLDGEKTEGSENHSTKKRVNLGGRNG